MSSDYNTFIDKLREDGYVITRRHNNHLRIEGHGVVYFASSSPSDWRVFEKIKRDLRKLRKDE